MKKVKKEYVLASDTTESDPGIGLIGPNILKIKTWVSIRNQSQELLPNIDKLLKKNKIKSEQLKWVSVNLGPGSFTGLRVGISIANTFGYGLNIPTIGQANILGDIKNRLKVLLELKTASKFFKQVLPEYGRDLRITKPKHK